MLHSVFRGAAPVPILHCYGLEDYTMAKRYSFQLCFSRDVKWDVEEFLKDTFPRKKQIILAPYHRGNSLAPYHRITEGTALRRITEGSASYWTITEGSASFWTISFEAFE